MSFQLVKKGLPAILLVAALIGTTPTAFVLADEYQTGPTLEEQVAQLESEIMGLTALVKSLSIQMEKVRQSSAGDIGEFQPRLLATEKLSKETAFEVKQMSATVGALVARVKELSLLPGEVYAMKDTLKELRYYFDDQTEIIHARLTNNEILIEELRQSTATTTVVLESMSANMADFLERMNANEANLRSIEDQVAGLQAGLDEVVNQAGLGQQALTGRVESLEAQFVQVQLAIATSNEITQTINQIEIHITEIAARSQAAQDNQEILMEMLRRLGGDERQAGSLIDQLDAVSAELGNMAMRAQQNAVNIEQNTQRLQMIQQRLADEPELVAGNAELQRLTQQIASAFSQFEGTQRALAQLQQSLSAAREEIKAEVLRSLPQVPDVQQINLLIQQSAEEQLREAQARAESAQSLALIALLVGLGGIAVALLL